MQSPTVTVIIPTLVAGPSLLECLDSLARQSWRDFEVLIVDNSARGLVRQSEAARLGPRILEPSENLGFGGALNLGIAKCGSPLVATLNDDAMARPEWLGELVAAMQARPDLGSCASRVVLANDGRLDSAGMLIAADGSSKQRGHGEKPERYAQAEEVLCPSGSAAIYRREMLEQVGSFDARFFLYCEDTDLGLRAQWAGWKCLYVPGAMAEHQYSQTSGNASPLKAYYVERNRLMVAAKNFPWRLLAAAPAASLARYGWHLFSVAEGRGAAARFQQGNHNLFELVYIVLRAHFAVLGQSLTILRERRANRERARIQPKEFRELLRRHSISLREVAAL